MNPESAKPASPAEAKPSAAGKPDRSALHPAIHRESAGGGPGGKDHAKASPEEIMADIGRTRAHMDETLDSLGRKLHPGPKGKAAAWGLAAAAAGSLAWLGFRAWRAVRGRKSRRHGPHFRWHEARVLEQAVLAAKLAKAARKGKPAIIVVEPRKA